MPLLSVAGLDGPVADDSIVGDISMLRIEGLNVSIHGSVSTVKALESANCPS
jgi:hypothetical protein